MCECVCEMCVHSMMAIVWLACQCETGMAAPEHRVAVPGALRRVRAGRQRRTEVHAVQHHVHAAHHLWRAREWVGRV